jgi:hypothetical protein
MPKTGRNQEGIRRELETERGELVTAVADLRAALHETSEKVARVKAKLPLIGAGGLLATGGLAALKHLRHQHDDGGTERFRIGRWSLHEHDGD